MRVSLSDLVGRFLWNWPVSARVMGEKTNSSWQVGIIDSAAVCGIEAKKYDDALEVSSVILEA